MIYEFFFLSYMLIFCYAKFYNINLSTLTEYFTFALALNVYFFYDVPFIYDAEYLFSNKQPFENISKLMICIIIYLFLDFYLCLNKSIKIDKILHHFGVIIASLLALFGNNVGVINNCVKAEVTNLWLNLYKISKKSNNIILKKIYPISVILFLFTYITHRIIPTTIIMIKVFYNFNILMQNIYSQFHVILFIPHIILQYYWFKIILTQFFAVIKEKLSNKIE